jgi:tetratricopeptide (TPR) repeat protein
LVAFRRGRYSIGGEICGSNLLRSMMRGLNSIGAKELMVRLSHVAMFSGERLRIAVSAVLAGFVLSACATTYGPAPTSARTDTLAAPTVLAADEVTSRETVRPAQEPPAIDLDRSASPPRKADLMYRLLVAEFAIRRGHPDLAVANYLEVAKHSPDPAIAERATRMALYARDDDAGRTAGELWVERAPQSLDAARVHAAMLIRSGDLEAGVAALVRIVENWNDPEGSAFAVVSDLLNRERSKARRVEVMEAVVARYPDNLDAKAALARVNARSGRIERALAIVEEVRLQDPTEDRHAVFEASLRRSQGKVEEALQVLADQLEKNPESFDLRLVYARFLVDAKRYEAARTEFDALVASEPDRADVRYALGLLLMQTNHYNDAEAHFRRLVELGERRPAAYFYLGQIAENHDDRASALSAYRKVDRGEHYLNAQIRVAVLYFEGDELARARQHLSAVRRESPQDDIRLFRAEAELVARADLLDEAIRVYDLALAAHPDNSDLLYARAMVAARAERLDVVESDLKAILSREPNNADALNALGYTLADRTDRLDEAHSLVKRAYELRPNDHYIVDSMGWVLYRMGRHEEAAQHLRRALSIKQDSEVAAHLGEVLWALGRKAEAREIWDAALKLTPNDKRLLETINRLED